MKKLVVLEPLGLEVKKLKEIADEVLGDLFDITIYDNRAEDAEILIERCKNSDVVMLSNIPYKKEVMSYCKDLKMLSVAFTGVDHIELDYANTNNITVSNSSGYADAAVSELVFGLVLSLLRKVSYFDKKTREYSDGSDLLGFELSKKKFGIIGAGRIGLTVANIAKAFGCDVYLYNRHPKNIIGMKDVSKEELLDICDIISLHLPLDKDTIAFIDEKDFERMKKNAIFINTARGPIVNTLALANALNNDIIAGAGIDVFDNEPPLDKNNPLLNAKNTILTPHIAFSTEEAMVKRAYIAFNNIKCWTEGTPINVVN